METATQALHTEADQLIRAMYTGKVGWTARERATELKRRAVFASVKNDPEALAALSRLVYGLPNRGLFQSIEPLLPSLGPSAGNTGFDALLQFARFHEHWRRDPEAWRPSTGDRLTQFRSLVRFLFADYPMPEFFDAAWLSGLTDEAKEYRNWYVHLGHGGKLEAIRFPMPMTHRAAHFFLLAPADYSIVSAMRYGQIQGLGGRENLARALAETFLNDRQPDEEFWKSVTHFLVNQPKLPLSQVGPIVDFIRFRRFGSSGSDAPEPTFSMKGRTMEALLKRVNEWHETLAHLKVKTTTWQPSGIDPLDYTEKDEHLPITYHWRIVGITDTRSLIEEGRTMRHCISTFRDACISGHNSVWSLRLSRSDAPGVSRLLTIGVNNHRHTIFEVRGKCNRSLLYMRSGLRRDRLRSVLRQWAHSQRLQITCNV